MDNKIELEVGEVARVGSRVVMCFLDVSEYPDSRCSYCCFGNNTSECDLVNCMDFFRRDDINVFFAEVKSINPNVLTDK